MALYIPHNIFHLVRLLCVRPETFVPYYVSSELLVAILYGSDNTKVTIMKISHNDDNYDYNLECFSVNK